MHAIWKLDNFFDVHNMYLRSIIWNVTWTCKGKTEVESTHPQTTEYITTAKVNAILQHVFIFTSKTIHSKCVKVLDLNNIKYNKSRELLSEFEKK